MSAQAGPGPSSTAYAQAQNKNGNATNPNGPSSVLAPLGGMAEEQEPGIPNIFTDAQLEEFKEQDRYLPVSLASWRLLYGFGQTVYLPPRIAMRRSRMLDGS